MSFDLSMFASLKPTASLQESLRDYGLNPAEWVLRRHNQRTFRIVHNQDKSFIFQGVLTAHQGQLAWAHISLISL